MPRFSTENAKKIVHGESAEWLYIYIFSAVPIRLCTTRHRKQVLPYLREYGRSVPVICATLYRDRNDLESTSFWSFRRLFDIVSTAELTSFLTDLVVWASTGTIVIKSMRLALLHALRAFNNNDEAEPEFSVHEDNSLKCRSD